MGLRRPCACAAPERVGEATPGPDTVAVIVAGGSGERFGNPLGKQFVPLCGLPLMAWSVLAFDRAPSVAHIVVVCAADRADEVWDDVLSGLTLRKPVTLAVGGATRQESVFNGLAAMPRGLDLVAIHDAARPLVETETIEDVIAQVRADQAIAGAICAARSVDTLKLVEGNRIIATPDRSFYWAAQTPQVFRTRPVVAAHKAARHEGFVGTDDASLVERNGGVVAVHETSRDNIKVTVPEDLALVEATLGGRLLGTADYSQGEGPCR